MSPKKTPRYKKFDVSLSTGDLTLYAAPRVLTALEQVTVEMSLYQGVRLAEVLKAVYEQGQKDGRKEMIEKMDALKAGINYLPPGRPKKKKKG